MPSRAWTWSLPSVGLDVNAKRSMRCERVDIDRARNNTVKRGHGRLQSAHRTVPKHARLYHRRNLPNNRRLLHGDHDGAERRACGYRRRRRYGNLAARRPGVARADGAESPWRDRGRRESAGATLLQHAADGAHDADISGAAAQVAAELEADAPLVGVGKTRDDVARRDQHSRRAEPALQTVLGRERAPQRDHDRVVFQSFDRRDLRALAQDRIGDARPRRLAVDQQRARTARTLLAAKMRAGQTEPFA